MSEQQGMDAVDRWLKYTSNYGISVVFLACVLLLFLWISFVTVSLLKKWVPAWFAWSIKSHQRTIKYLDAATGTLTCVHDKVHNLTESQHHLTKAATIAARESKYKLNIPSNVIFHLESAAKASEDARSSNKHNHSINPEGSFQLEDEDGGELDPADFGDTAEFAKPEDTE